MTTQYLSREEAAAYICGLGLRTTKNTLQKFATVGGGPRYRRFGLRAVYTKSDLDEWIKAKLTPPRASSSAA